MLPFSTVRERFNSLKTRRIENNSERVLSIKELHQATADLKKLEREDDEKDGKSTLGRCQLFIILVHKRCLCKYTQGQLYILYSIN